MDDSPIEVRHGEVVISTDRTRIDPDAALALLRATHWGTGMSRETLTRAIANSICFGVYHGRELIGYVPWQFNLPDPGKGYERAWRLLMDSSYFLSPFGPTTVERHDPQFFISPRCCWWSGNSWPYATTQTLVARTS